MHGIHFSKAHNSMEHLPTAWGDNPISEVKGILFYFI